MDEQENRERAARMLTQGSAVLDQRKAWLRDVFLINLEEACTLKMRVEAMMKALNSLPQDDSGIRETEIILSAAYNGICEAIGEVVRMKLEGCDEPKGENK